ncbi:hypothetical protein EJ03DRAFT_332152 [Teratosphaeria nubilosa]|uniref:Uncharacterized protein n=1 Tax=Teratosphaeria nubilosa TaxID=161662 RepID=A0A6G1KTZ2_9PEZI|nr:hypothetical protein EJ03DRAFT_332152 [Teratosphaeria nubilosa]
MAPEYYFSIAVMYVHQAARTRVAASPHHGAWMPPKARGANVRGCSTWFKHTDQATQPTAEVPEAVTAQDFACYSIYHDHGVFYTVNYDATTNKVGDGDDATAAQGNGRDSSSDDSSGSSVVHEEEDHDDWSTITFNWADQQRKISYAGQKQPFQRLPLRRTDLPLLIGLVAFAMPEIYMPGYLAINLGNTFSAPQNFPRGCGCEQIHSPHMFRSC